MVSIPRIAGFAQEGDFDINADYLTVHTPVVIGQTGVTLTRAELVTVGYLASATLGVGNPITVNGVTYTADAAYDDALYAQRNLEQILGAVTASATLLGFSAGRTSAALGTTFDAGLFPGTGNTVAGTDIDTTATPEVYTVVARIPAGALSLARFGDNIDGRTFYATSAAADQANATDINGGVAVAAGGAYAMVSHTDATLAATRAGYVAGIAAEFPLPVGYSVA